MGANELSFLWLLADVRNYYERPLILFSCGGKTLVHVDRFMAVSDTYDYAVPDISGISSCSAAHQPLLIQPALQQHPQQQPKLPAVSPPSLAIEIDTLASSSHSTVTNGSASSASRVAASATKNNNQIGHYASESSPLKKVFPPLR